MVSRIALLKAVDFLLGRMAVPLSSLLSPRTNLSGGAVNSLLLIRPGGIGDAVLLIPAIRAIRKQYPSAKITVLAERRNASVFQFCPEVANVLLYDRPAGLVSALRPTYDVVIDTEQWHRLSAVVARMTRAQVLIGYATNERSRLFTHPVAYSHDDYETDSFLHLLAPLGVEPDRPTEKFLVVPSDAGRRAEELLASLGTRQYVAIFPGASIPERKWGSDRFRQIAELLKTFGITAVVVGGKEDRGQGDAIVAGGVGLNVAGRTTLPETAAIIEKSALLVSGDSGILHIAVGLGRPTVSLFGPGRSRKWAPRDERHLVINKELPCSPCTTFGTTTPCPINARCMKEITVDEVFNAVMMLLTATGALPSPCCKKDWIEVADNLNLNP
jgi:ADP-heptose:LPS heptosyltransferase